MLPVLTARAPALLCPANLAPLAARNVVVVIHDAAPLRHPGLVLGPVRGRPAPAAAADRPPRAAGDHGVRVLTQRAGRAARRRCGGRAGRRRPAVHAAGAPQRDRPYVLTVASHTARKNLSALVPAAQALAREGVDLLVAGGHRPQFAAEANLDRADAARPRPGRRAARPVRRRRGVRAAERLRGLRPAGTGGDGERHAGRRREHDRAARDVRRRGAPRRAGRRRRSAKR